MSSDPLSARLSLLGLRGVARIVTHTNRIVMVSLGARGVLRLHRGYAHAPDRVLRAIIRFLDARLPRVEHRMAEREFIDYCKSSARTLAGMEKAATTLGQRMAEVRKKYALK